MKIEAVDFFYLSMPELLDIGDGSQDALLVRIRSGGLEGWGECEASPLTSIASYVTPMSHSASKPLRYSVEGKHLDSPEDIRKISDSVHLHSFDLLQADHTLSGIDAALWDLLGKIKGEPVYALLGYDTPYPKLPYASQLFGVSPEDTFQKAKKLREAGFKAMKFGWGSFGEKDLARDIAQLMAAREGCGGDGYLMIDAGTVWKDRVQDAKQRMAVLKEINAYWLEEPFTNLALHAYKQLSLNDSGVALAAGEGCNNFEQAAAMVQHAGLKYIQIDAGRIGGITVAKKVADLALQSGIHYMNHTFTSNLSLSASMQPFAGIEKDFLCEYPTELKPLAMDIGNAVMQRDENGYVQMPDKPGLGINVDIQSLKKYLVDVEIRIQGKQIYHTPGL
jgi:L-alanine-DL-glutamate epimerase-like enolase superfamily enzyme